MDPPGTGPHPAVVLVHGGGWIVGNPSTMMPLAESLASNGYLTVNTPYQLSIQAPGFPAAIDDVACAVRYAAAHPESNGEVTIIGHSAGAHIAAIAALSGDAYGADCPWEGTGLADAFIGLAGPYDVDRLGGIMNAFFGSQRSEAPDAWEAGSPHLLEPANRDLKVLLLHGSIDQVVNVDFSENFFEILDARGVETNLTVVEGVEHAGVRDPEVVTELILDWLG